MEMFGIEKAFSKNKNKVENKSASVSDALENKESKTESEIVFFNQSIEKGQTWETEDGQWEITIANHNKGSDRYEIVVKDKKTGNKDSLLESSEEVKARLLDKNYQLCAQEVEQPGNEELLQEYLALDQEMALLLEEKINELATVGGETIEKNKEVLGEKYEDFYSVRSVILKSIEALVAEENALAESLETQGGITEDLLEVRKVHHKKLFELSTALETMNVLVNQEIAKREEMSGVKGVEEEEVVSVQSGSVIDISEYRESKEKELNEHESLALFEKGSSEPRKKKEQGDEESEEKSIDAEQKIGKEKYAALIQMVENTWQSLERELQKAKIPHRVLDKIWTTEVLPDLEGKMKEFLRKRTELGLEERESICKGIMQTISEKK